MPDMPPPTLIDTSLIDVERVIFSRQQIYEVLPHRYEFMQLTSIVHYDEERMEAAARRDVSGNEFWARGHIPGRPIFPGIMMLESAAHLASFVTTRLRLFGDRFMGFGGLNGVKFRGAVRPGQSLLILARLLEVKSRRVVCAAQGLEGDRLVFEGEITGMPM